ncbi:MAG: glycyl-radical enzyme activating protein [Clostridia bacterium]|nr:glycyl-radical enzyme activating protein [Clostridia bacterium]
MKGLIFNIQKFCINDGPGIRTTVFLKGCPLRCEWCHNPESHRMACELSYAASDCIGCGECFAVCKQKAHIFDGAHTLDRNKCILCGECAEKCYVKALEFIGKEKTVDEVMAEVIKDKTFYDNSGGGLTVSGGEPLMQFQFVYELLKTAKEKGIHTCIETSGFTEREKILKIAEFTDIFLYDWKITDAQLHKKYTGVSNTQILDNVKALDSLGAKIILRCPIIPAVNDTEEHLNGIAALANSLENILGIEIEPYHSLGNNKYQRLEKSRVKTFEMPEEEEILYWIEKIKGETKVTVKKA